MKNAALTPITRAIYLLRKKSIWRRFEPPPGEQLYTRCSTGGPFFTNSARTLLRSDVFLKRALITASPRAYLFKRALITHPLAHILVYITEFA